MTTDLVSLAIITLVAAICPLVAKSIPRQPIPETVFLIAAGALLGPAAAGIIDLTDSIDLVSELGLAFLFLLAGFEIDPKGLMGSQGKRGAACWLISLGLGFLVVYLVPSFSADHLESVAVAIALGSTALGTLLPILKERGLMQTRIGASVCTYGTWGELGPVVAMALLLSARAEWITVLLLMVFAGLAVLAGHFSKRAKLAGNKVYTLMTIHANTTSQTVVRSTIVLLITLVALSSVFDLDVVIGAFAAGFILRYLEPDSDRDLAVKLDGVAYGFFIPIFFIVSGARINLAAIVSAPALLLGFVALCVLVRGVPIFISLCSSRETRTMNLGSRLTVALYCTTALPVIVAVTSIAVKAEAMPADTASVLVAAGALTVLIMPVLAGFISHLFPDIGQSTSRNETATSPNAHTMTNEQQD